jgi:cell division protein FtsQ
VSSGLLDSLRSAADAARPSNARRRLLIGAGALVALAVLGVWLFAFSPVFGVRSVTVRGTHLLTARQVEDAAHIAHGTPLLRLNEAAITRRVEQLPEVGSAQVSTSYPSTVTITITERVPVGYVKQGNGYALVDRTGAQYRTTATKPAKLPLFVVPSGADARTSGSALATVAAALPERIRAKTASIQALNPQAITLVLKDQRVVQWGSADRSAEKARVLAALLPRADQQIDVTDPDQPFTR